MYKGNKDLLEITQHVVDKSLVTRKTVGGQLSTVNFRLLL